MTAKAKQKSDKKKLVLTNKYKITRIDRTSLGMHSLNRSYLRIRDFVKDLQVGDIVVEKIYLTPDGEAKIEYERDSSAESNS